MCCRGYQRELTFSNLPGENLILSSLAGMQGADQTINTLPSPILLQEKTTQSREQPQLMVAGQDLFYTRDILILKFKSDNGWVCLWLQGNVNIIVPYSCSQEKSTFILCDWRISSNSLVWKSVARVLDVSVCQTCQDKLITGCCRHGRAPAASCIV